MAQSKKFLVLITPILLLILFLYLFLMDKNSADSYTMETETAIPTSSPITISIDSPVPSPASPPTLLAFPGAEGFGSQAIGGRGGQVIEVSNLSDSGPGSLRAAVEAAGPRIVVFKVAGTIELDSSLEIKEPYITIAGQTAPGGGITLKNSPSNEVDALIISTHDVIIRYIRSRPGPPQAPSSNGDALEILGPDAYNVMIDHCSFSWAIDEVVSTWYDARNISIQWSIISEGLNCSTHTKGCHSMGLLLGSEGSRNISVHHNLFAHNDQRNPLIQTNGAVDVVNNVIYNTLYTPITINDGYGFVSANIIGNYYKQLSDNSEFLLSASSENGPGMAIYVKDNIGPSRSEEYLANDLAVKPAGREWLVSTWNTMPPITTTSVFQAYEEVLAGAGASYGIDSLGKFFQRRDTVDERIVGEVREGGGHTIDDPADVGGWPCLSIGTAWTDSDKDGMPDEWEMIHGFDPQDPSDGPRDLDGDGYTNIEEYLNGTDPKGF